MEHKKDEDDLLSRLDAAAAGEHLNVIKVYVVQVLQRVLDQPLSTQIDEKKGFFDMGLDSINAVDFTTQLQAGIGKEPIIPSTAVFDESSVEKLSQYLFELFKIESLEKNSSKNLSDTEDAKQKKIEKETLEMNIDDARKALEMELDDE